MYNKNKHAVSNTAARKSLQMEGWEESEGFRGRTSNKKNQDESGIRGEGYRFGHHARLGRTTSTYTPASQARDWGATERGGLRRDDSKLRIGANKRRL